MVENITQHKLDLARELLGDIELSRLGPEQLLLKTSRLARLVEAPNVETWIRYELIGYVANDPIAEQSMSLFGRWTDREKKQGYWMPLAELEGYKASLEARLRQLKVPDVTFSPTSANPNEFVTGYIGQHVSTATAPITNVLNQMQSLSNAIGTLSGIRSRVLAGLHMFVVRTYHELAFGGMAETIFERYQRLVNEALSSSAGESIKKIPAIYDRLVAGDKEAISQALTTCRRMIQSCADAVYPPRETEATREGVKVGKEHHLNRIDQFVGENCTSASRRQRLRKTLREVHDRVTAGIHSDVTVDEAKALFLQTYITLGEIILIPKEEKETGISSPSK